MIAARLFGGLGNQMFIYANARAISLRKDVQTTFNIIDGFKEDLLYRRNLELCHFKLELISKNKILLFSVPFGSFFNKLSNKFSFHFLQPQYTYIKEDKNFHFQKEILNIKSSNIYLNGYWQSPLYFEDSADIIHRDFEIKVPLPEDTKNELDFLKETKRTLIFVGIRRYQEAIGKSCPLTVCGAEYYNKGMEIMKKKFKNPLFVILGEQKDWAERNLNQDFDMYYVKKKYGELGAISDMYIMKNCHHAIISNSTYYWWGAWLQVKNQKEHCVIAPDNFINPDTPCKEWEILKLEDCSIETID